MPIPTSWLAAVPPLALADALTRREQDGRRLLAAGKHDAEIAATLGTVPIAIQGGRFPRECWVLVGVS